MATLLQSIAYISRKADGTPNALGKVYTYAAGTLTPLASYTTQAGDVENTNPVILGADGTAQLWVSSSTAYRIIEKTSADVTIRDEDNISGAQSVAADLASTATGMGDALIGVKLNATGAADRTQHNKNADAIYASDFTGYDPTGSTSSVAALVAADTAARAAKRALRISGTPLIDSTVTISVKTHWIFEGSSGAAQGDLPSTYLKKAASLNGPAVRVTADGTKFDGGGIVGDVGNVGDGIQITGNSFHWVGAPYIYRMGQDGIRIGSDSAAVNLPNAFYIEHAKSSGNGRHGIHINDAPGSYPNANAGMLVAPFCHHNTGHGLYINNANLGNVIICPLLEANTGAGLYLDTEANRNLIIGGDIEANGTDFINNASLKLGNRLIDVSIAAIVTSTHQSTSIWTPAIYGGSSAGAGTYTVQQGVYTFTGGALNFSAEVTWTAHTGTGQIYMDLPNITGSSIQTVIGDGVPDFIPALVSCDGFTLTAGTQVQALVNTLSSPPRLQMYTNITGALSAMGMTAAGTLRISGTVSVINL